jgi:hypothetical protein
MSSGTNKLGNNGGREYSFLNRPVWIDCNFIVDSANGNGLGIRSLKGAGVRNVFMHTSATPGKGLGGYLNPNPASGYAIIQLHNNYNRYCGGFSGVVAPLTGSSLAINGSALTANAPYVITSVGHAAAGAVTIAPVADVSGSLASTWFSLYDGYGNTFIIWFYVTGVGGSAPVGVSGTLVQQTIAENASAATIGGALASTIALLPSGVSGIYSFTTTGTTTVTATSTQVNPYGPVAGPPADGLIATGFTFAKTVYNTNQTCWQGVGLPAGVAPNVGAAFIASATGFSAGGGSTGTVQAPGAGAVQSLSVVGDPNQTLSPVPMGGSPNVGGLIMVQFNAATSSSVTTPVATAPVDNSIVGLGFYVEAGSIQIAGE